MGRMGVKCTDHNFWKHCSNCIENCVDDEKRKNV